MEQFGVILIVGFVALAATLFAVLSAKARRARVEALKQLASRLGWTLEPGWIKGSGSLFGGGGRCAEHPYQLFTFFHQGDSRGFYNTLAGPAESGGIALRCLAGDYQWSTGSGKNRSTHRRSYLVVDASHDLGQFPPLGIRPETWGDRLLEMLGGGDIDFESEEFSRAFRVTSPDKKFAFAVIHPRMMEFLLSGAPQKLEMNGGCGVLISQFGVWDPREFEWAVGWVREFLAQWPSYLVEELRGRGGSAGTLGGRGVGSVGPTGGS